MHVKVTITGVIGCIFVANLRRQRHCHVIILSRNLLLEESIDVEAVPNIELIVIRRQLYKQLVDEISDCCIKPVSVTSVHE